MLLPVPQEARFQAIAEFRSRISAQLAPGSYSCCHSELSAHRAPAGSGRRWRFAPCRAGHVLGGAFPRHRCQNLLSRPDCLFSRGIATGGKIFSGSAQNLKASRRQRRTSPFQIAGDAHRKTGITSNSRKAIHNLLEISCGFVEQMKPVNTFCWLDKYAKTVIWPYFQRDQEDWHLPQRP